MQRTRLLTIAVLTLFILPFAAADCKYHDNGAGFPLGMIPSPSSLNVSFTKPEQQNVTFVLYLEAEIGTATKIRCDVDLSIENRTDNLDIQLSNYSFQSTAYFHSPVTVIMTPKNIVNFPDVIHSSIVVTDVAQPWNRAVIPINAVFKFDRNKPTPISSQGAGNTAQPDDTSILPIVSKKPDSGGFNSSFFGNLVGGVEDSTSKYVLAVVAFFFLAAILWLGFNSLQRD